MSHFTEIRISQQISKNTKFHKNPSSGSRVVPWQTDMTKLIVVFCNFVSAPNNGLHKQLNLHTEIFLFKFYKSDQVLRK
jgi:hypothetical protein